MTAIRNVGGLASPYYLLEVWAQREQIDIDPETYASLKRKARALVRDFRAFDLRAEEPDLDWQVRRLDLLGVDSAVPRTVRLDDGTPFALLVWGVEGHDALLIGDLPGARDPDVRPPDAADPLATQFELALDAYEGAADWGLLLAGINIRVYRRSSGISQQYLELSLDDLVELDDESAWRAFAAIFRVPAFAAPPDGTPLIVRVVDESRRHATALADDMRTDVVDAAEALLQAVLDHPGNRDRISEPSRPELQHLFEQTLYYLYRALFVFFAESRDVLRIDGAGPYATTYSMHHLVELARSSSPASGGTYFSAALHRLFELLWHGPTSLSRALGVEPVGGDLFDPANTALLDACVIDDVAWARALTSITLGAPGTARRRQAQHANFAELGVDQLGSIYEGLLVLEPFLAPGPRLLVNIDGERRVLEPDAAEGYQVLRRLEAGDFVLESASGRRKGSGSFYTPHEITEFLAHAALDLVVEPLIDLAADDPAEAVRQLLALRVCDPAMGSGAFLVQAARVLGRGLARIRAVHGDGRVTPDLVHRGERDVVRECLYGVDLNPLAVVLAKVSLWLETLEPGKPLSFLDAHLRCGDSLVGVNFTANRGSLTAAELATWPAVAHKGLERYLKAEAGERGEPVLARLKGRKAPKQPKQATLPGIDAFAIERALEKFGKERAELIAAGADNETLDDALAAQLAFQDLEHAEESLRNRVRVAADFWCAQWFSDGEDAPADAQGPVPSATIGDFDIIMACLVEGKPVPEGLGVHLEAAARIAKKRRFFHWALEFPEVIVERGGFDAVLGNPPWNETTPTPREFFATYDPQVFRRGVPRAVQARRQAELRKDADIDAAWRTEARWLHELSSYAKPESGRFNWYAPEGQLRKGDANVFRLFVERGYLLLRPNGRLAQVLPDSVYVSSPATGVRQHLLTEGELERCYVFENRKGIFPIHRSVKVVLLTARRGGGPTTRFHAAFYVGKDPAGRDRAVGLDTLPAVLADAEQHAATLSIDQIRNLAPANWSFPELQTALDAEIITACGNNAPPLNLDDRGWGLQYCRELDATNDAWRFRDAMELQALGAQKQGLRWRMENKGEWWPIISGTHFYHLNFLAEGKEPQYWADGDELRKIKGRLNVDGSSVGEHYRVGWRLVARSTDERSAIACVLPPRTICTNAVLTIWGGLLPPVDSVKLASVLTGFVFDYLVRFAGRTNLTYGAVASIPVPHKRSLDTLVQPASEVLAQSDEFADLWLSLFSGQTPPKLDRWQVGERRAQIDALVAIAYKMSLEHFAAVLCAFPNIDKVQPMLPGEPKSFVTRDLALLAYCELTDRKPPDVSKLLREIGVDLPDPRPEYRHLDVRVAAARDLGAIPYKSTPRGGKAPTDPALIEAVQEILGIDALTAAEIAETVEEAEKTVVAVLRNLEKEGLAFAEGRGKKRRYYVIEDE